MDDLIAKANSYKESHDYSSFGNNFVSVTKSNIYLTSDPIAPSNKTSPSNARNAIIGALLGAMIAVLIVLIREHIGLKPISGESISKMKRKFE